MASPPAGFVYHSGKSTSHIIFYDDNAHLNVLSLRPIQFGPIGAVNPQQFTILSSSQGLIACRNNATNTYFVSNPVRFKFRDDLPLCDVPLNNGCVVLGFDSPFVLVSSAGIQAGNYIIHAYNYHDDFLWRSFSGKLSCETYGPVVPHSGVAHGREAFWILQGSARNPRSLLRFVGDVRCALPVSILDLPSFPSQVRMQLGRAMGRLGLVVVNETNSTVELFTLQEHRVKSGHPWLRRGLFSIEILQQQQQRIIDHADGNQEAENSIASWRQEDMTLVCREMPRPIRFDSFKVELLFWVQGRVLLLESGDTDSLKYQLTVIPDRDVPPAITDGIPHVFNGLH